MTGERFEVRHVDLAAGGEERDAPAGPALSVFWWNDLPLGMRAALPEELPYGRSQLRRILAECGAAQLEARSAGLGAPLRATCEGWPKRALSLASVREAKDLVRGLQDVAAASSASAEDVSVVICTRDRGPLLERCLRSLEAQRSPAGEVIVVDNSRDRGAEACCGRFPRIRYLHEPRPGLSRARNAGVRESRLGIVAFTDDDVEVHPGWTAEIARTFAERDVEALTGLVLPARLDTAAERCFQFAMGGFGSTFVPLAFGRPFFEETRPNGARVWKIGAGANMAFRRSALERVGPFDERLGAGASGCSEDSELWYRLLATGGTCQYEPRIVVFHHHRSDWPGLRRQMRSYMKGHVSALVVQYDNFGDRGNLVRIRRQLPAYFVRTFFGSLFDGHPGRMAILLAEISGFLAGLTYLLRPGWRRRRAKSAALGEGATS